MKKVFENIIGISLAIAIMTPFLNLVHASTLQVNQPVCDNLGVCSSGGGSPAPSTDKSSPRVSNVTAKAGYSSAIISWSTDELTLGKVEWGKNDDYRDGQISVEQYKTAHQAEIINLKPEQQYYFKITSFDQSGNKLEYRGKFLTLKEPDLTPPQNVRAFTVAPAQVRMNLSWLNPDDVDFDSVRVVRSEKFYPIDPLNGEVVYEGKGQSVFDGAVNPGIVYYYAIFTKDIVGNYSTGAVGAGMILWYSDPLPSYPDAPIVDIDFPSAPGQISNPATSDDFNIIYNDGSTSVNFDHPTIPAGDNIKITVPGSELPSGAMSITLTIKDDATGETLGTYLFTYEKLTKMWYVTIPALLREKIYRFIITIYNSAHQVIQEITKIVRIAPVKAGTNSAEPSANAFPFLIPIITVVGLFVIYLISHYFFPQLLAKSIPVRRPRVRKKHS